VKIGDLVKAPLSSRPLGVGLVTKNLGVHCMVQWTYDPQDTRLDPGPTLEANSTLEVISESR